MARLKLPIRRSGQERRRRAQVSTKPGIGIDIGAYTTKLVHFDPASEEPYTCAVLPTNAGTLGTAESDDLGPDGLLAANKQERHTDKKLDFSRWSQKQVDSLAQRIQSAIVPGFMARRIRATISMDACDLRSVAVYAQEELTRSAVIERLQSAINDNRVRSVAVLDGQQEQNRIKALSVPVDLTDAIAIGLDSKGMTPESIEGQPWTLARLVDSRDKDELHTLVDWGYTQPTLVCSVHGQVRYVRRLKAGSIRDMIQPVMNEYGIQAQEAIRWLELSIQGEQANSGFDIRSDLLVERAHQASRQLAAEIDAALEFIRWKNPDQKIGPIVFAGGGASLTQLSDLVTRSIDGDACVWSSKEQDMSPVYAQAAILAKVD
ncbi:MAG: hypothetical protein Aurels2KO_13780 [Aureliella sp.]